MKRVDANLIPFAKNNPSGYRFAFGTDTATDDINVNYNDNIKKGWGTTPNEFPEVEDFNAMAYTSSYLTAYLYQMGIAEWNNKQNYRANSRVIASDGNLYKSLTGTSETPNTGNNPLSDVVNWGIDNQFYINSLASKATPLDTDNFGIQEAGGLFKKLSWANIKTVLGSLYVGLTGNQTIAGIKTFSSNIIGSITGNAGSATGLQGDEGNWASYRSRSVANMLGWKNYGNGHCIFDASAGTTPNGVAVNNTNPAIPWSPPCPTLMGWNGSNTHGVRVDSARVADSTTYATAFTTAVGSAPSYACRAWVNFNGTGTVAIRASGNVSSITDNGVGNYTVNFTTAMADANYVAQISLGNSNNDHGYVLSLNTGNVTVGNSVANAVALVDPLYALVSIIR